MKAPSGHAFKKGIPKINSCPATYQKEFYDRIRTLLTEEIKELSGDIDLTQNRYDRFRNLGVSAVIKE